MKDQKALVGKCLTQDIPVFVLCGNDRLAVETLEFYSILAKYKNCGNDFLNELQLIKKEFTKYQEDERKSIKLPD